MKQFLNFKLILSLGLFIGMSVVAQAQPQSDDAATQARATIVQQIVVTKVADLDFTLVSPGVSKSISHSGSTLVSGGTATGGEARGVFTVSAGEGTSVDLSYTFPEDLLNVALDELPITFTSGYGFANDNDATAPVTMAGITNIEEFPAGSVFVMLGGTVSPAANQAPGLYTANVTLKAEYN